MAGLTDAQAGKIAKHLKLSPDGPSYEAVRSPRCVSRGFTPLERELSLPAFLQFGRIQP